MRVCLKAYFKINESKHTVSKLSSPKSSELLVVIKAWVLPGLAGRILVERNAELDKAVVQQAHLHLVRHQGFCQKGLEIFHLEPVLVGNAEVEFWVTRRKHWALRRPDLGKSHRAFSRFLHRA